MVTVEMSCAMPQEVANEDNPHPRPAQTARKDKARAVICVTTARSRIRPSLSPAADGNMGESIGTRSWADPWTNRHRSKVTFMFLLDFSDSKSRCFTRTFHSESRIITLICIVFVTGFPPSIIFIARSAAM